MTVAEAIESSILFCYKNGNPKTPPDPKTIEFHANRLLDVWDVANKDSYLQARLWLAFSNLADLDPFYVPEAFILTDRVIAEDPDPIVRNAARMKKVWYLVFMGREAECGTVLQSIRKPDPSIAREKMRAKDVLNELRFRSENGNYREIDDLVSGLWDLEGRRQGRGIVRDEEYQLLIDRAIEYWREAKFASEFQVLAHFFGFYRYIDPFYTVEAADLYKGVLATDIFDSIPYEVYVHEAMIYCDLMLCTDQFEGVRERLEPLKPKIPWMQEWRQSMLAYLEAEGY